MLPLSATVCELGATSVTMSKTRDITILFNDEKSMVVVNSLYLRKGFLRAIKLNSPVILYLNKAMAGGEFYQYITGRNFIEKDDIIIILPNGLKPDENTKNQILQSARNLF